MRRQYTRTRLGYFVPVFRDENCQSRSTIFSSKETTSRGESRDRNGHSSTDSYTRRHFSQSTLPRQNDPSNFFPQDTVLVFHSNTHRLPGRPPSTQPCVSSLAPHRFFHYCSVPPLTPFDDFTLLSDHSRPRPPPLLLHRNLLITTPM